MTTRAEFAAASLPAKMVWWKACFEDAARRQQPGHVRQRVDDISRLLKLEERSRVLDLCCGLGQETLELARRGHRVLGVDETEDALREGRVESKGTSLFCHFMKADLRNIPYSGEFDAILLRHPAFGSHPKERDDQRCLEGVRKALKPDGKLLLKVVSRDWVIRHLSINRHEHGLNFDLSTGRLEGYRGTRDSRVPTSCRLYTLTELLRMLAVAGLTTREVFGRFDGGSYGLDSFNLIILAERTKDAPRAKHEDDGLVRALKIKGRGR